MSENNSYSPRIAKAIFTSNRHNIFGHSGRGGYAPQVDVRVEAYEGRSGLVLYRKTVREDGGELTQRQVIPWMHVLGFSYEDEIIKPEPAAEPTPEPPAAPAEPSPAAAHDIPAIAAASSEPMPEGDDDDAPDSAPAPPTPAPAVETKRIKLKR